MKKILKRTIAAVFAALIFTTGTNAASTPTIATVGELGKYLINTSNGNMHIEYERPGAIRSQAEWKSAINAATSELTSSVTLNIANFNNDDYDLSKIADYNMSISASGTIGKDVSAITYTFTYSPNYRILRAYEDSSLLPVLTGDELAALTRAYEIKNEIITSDMTDYEKELTIHDYIIANYSYNVDAVSNDSANSLRTHSITGMLLDGNGVCEAYANTFMLLCRMSGLNCELATGTLDGVKHQWNIVELNGEYYNVDLTSDDPVPDIKGRVGYRYFNLSDAELSKTHVSDSTNRSCNGVRFNYYSYNNLVVTSYEDLSILLNDKLDRGIKTITFKTDESYILQNSEDIKKAVEGRGLTSLLVAGEYGKSGIFTATFA
jgi:transglutaminase/protease-like cytokinesis protein 3